MDQGRSLSGLEQTYRLLALCARPEGHPALYERLAGQLRGFSAWNELPRLAELHGMAPLFRHHLKAAGLAIPPGTMLVLDGLALRHRLHNQQLAKLLNELNRSFKRDGVPYLVLKGLALAYGYYPDPALRPVSDIDLLVQKEHMHVALASLKKSGFAIELPDPLPDPLPTELKAQAPLPRGATASLELHHYDPRARRMLYDGARDREFAGFDGIPASFRIGRTAISAPSPVDTLRFLWEHLIKHLFYANADAPLQLKWMADIIAVVERHAVEFDWSAIRQQQPDLLRRLEVLYSLTPMPDHLQGIIPVESISPATDLHCYPGGWPQYRTQEWKRVGLLHIIWGTLKAPPARWLQLFYGIGRRSVLWYGQFVYRLRVLWLLCWKVLLRLAIVS